MRLTGLLANRARKAGVVQARRGRPAAARVRASRAWKALLARGLRRTCSRGRPPGSRRSRRCGCPGPRGTPRGIGPVVLDGQVGDAAPRIELDRARGRRWSGRCRGRRWQEPQWSASAASGGRSRVGQDRAQEQPGAELARRPGWCACPASRGRRARPAAFPSAARCRRTPSPRTPNCAASQRGQRLQPLLDQLVIVVALGVDRDGARGRGRASDRQRIVVRARS